MENEGEEDSVLAARAARGDAAAFALLVARYRGRVLRLALSLARDRAVAEDITQETFLRAFRSLRGFRGDAAFYTWLYKIGQNAARDLLRSRSGSLVGAPGAMPAPETPETSLECAQRAAGMMLALERLPPPWRVAITLREMDGLSYQEIAAAMGCPLGTVRSRLARARGALRDGMQRPRQAI